LAFEVFDVFVMKRRIVQMKEGSFVVSMNGTW
jgi:hypothetical protein